MMKALWPVLDLELLTTVFGNGILLESDVGVDEKGGAENRICGGIERATSEGSNSQGDQTGGNQPWRGTVSSSRSEPFSLTTSQYLTFQRSNGSFHG